MNLGERPPIGSGRWLGFGECKRSWKAATLLLLSVTSVSTTTNNAGKKHRTELKFRTFMAESAVDLWV